VEVESELSFTDDAKPRRRPAKQWEVSPHPRRRVGQDVHAVVLLEQKDAVGDGKQEKSSIIGFGVADEAPLARHVTGDEDRVQHQVLHPAATVRPLTDWHLAVDVLVQERLGRLPARVLGVEAPICGDTAPRLAHGAVADDVLDQQVDEDLRVVVLAEARHVGELCLHPFDQPAHHIAHLL
jgi:hypothetical protein